MDSRQHWKRWRNLVPGDRKRHASHCPGDVLHYIFAPIILYVHCGGGYERSESTVWYTYCRGWPYAVVIYTTYGDVDAFPRLSAIFYLSAAIIYSMWHSPNICLALICCHLSQLRLRFGNIACHWICFTNVILYRFELFCSIFTLTSTIPSALHILHWFIIGLQCFIHFIQIDIITIITLIPADITGCLVKPVN
jgi:hypothetical protein